MKPGGWQILIILIVLIVVFGAGKLPSIASSIGQSLKIFKKEVSELRDDTDTTTPPARRDDVPRASYDATAPHDEVPRPTQPPTPPRDAGPDDVQDPNRQ